MKYDPKEDYEVWVERMRIYELGIAYQRLAQGDNPKEIAQDLSFRLTNKVLHPLYQMVTKEDKKFDITH